MILSVPTIKSEVQKDGAIAQAVVVCADCFPNETVYAFYPCLNKIPLSHGVCPVHGQAMLKSYQARKAALSWLAVRSFKNISIAY